MRGSPGAVPGAPTVGYCTPPKFQKIFFPVGLNSKCWRRMRRTISASVMQCQWDVLVRLVAVRTRARRLLGRELTEFDLCELETTRR